MQNAKTVDTAGTLLKELIETRFSRTTSGPFSHP